MKIRYFSDLHLDFISPNKLQKLISKIIKSTDKEICVLAGDIGNPYTANYNVFIEFINTHFSKTFIITGNHEYYNINKTIEETNIYLEEYFTNYKNITFLNNQFEDYENFRFIGSTLWSKVTNPTYEISDIDNIKNFNYLKNNQLNMINVDFIENTLENSTNNCIIITHHLPSKNLIQLKYKTSVYLPYTQWFYSDLDDLIKNNKDKIKCWIYGHTHTESTILLNNVPFLCNPLGYPNENIKYDFTKNIIL
jgi:predicted MPP superfamily phosphohydrolase